jgi:hypothetical protein
MYYYVEHAIITKLKEEAETTSTVLLEGNSCSKTNLELHAADYF